MGAPIFTPVLQLGNFDFIGVEQPESLTFGKEQVAYKHILIGGARIIDLLGAGNPDITWSGYFVGQTAILRAQELESVVQAGQPLQLTTGQFVKQVVITSFTYDFHFVFPVKYTITVQVIQDQTSPVNFLIPGDLTQVVLGYILQAQDIATLIANPSINSALALSLIAAEAAAPFDGATNVAINGMISAAQAAQAVIGGAIQAAESNIFG